MKDLNSPSTPAITPKATPFHLFLETITQIQLIYLQSIKSYLKLLRSLMVSCLIEVWLQFHFLLNHHLNRPTPSMNPQENLLNAHYCMHIKVWLAFEGNFVLMHEINFFIDEIYMQILIFYVKHFTRVS